MPKYLLAALALALAACSSAPDQWISPNGDPQQRLVDNADCRGFARSNDQPVTAVGTPAFVLGAVIGNAIGNGVRAQADYRDCMEARGYVPTQGAP
jgi:hypothetical protein